MNTDMSKMMLLELEEIEIYGIYTGKNTGKDDFEKSLKISDSSTHPS